MIHSDINIGIIYGGKGINLADKLKNIILTQRENGKNINYICIDDQIISEKENLDSRVFLEFEKCNLFFVLLTEDVKIKEESGEEKWTSRPNVFLELGYALKLVGRDNIAVLSNFSYDKIKQQLYFMPSDIINQIVYVMDMKKLYSELETILNKFTQSRGIDYCMPNLTDNSKMNYLLNPQYQINYSELFMTKELIKYDNYSYDKQMESILSDWIYEINLIGDVDKKIVYLYERIIFCAVFSEKAYSDKVINLFTVQVNNDERFRTVVNILNIIRYYIAQKNEQVVITQGCYTNNYNAMIKEIKKLNKDINPVVFCIAYNYLGLFYSQTARNIKHVNNGDTEESKKLFKQAEESFKKVIEKSDLYETTCVFKAFAYYNIANVKLNMYENPIEYYEQAINYRRILSRERSFPKIFQQYFCIERIYAEIVKTEFQYDYRLISKDKFNESICKLFDEINEEKENAISNNSLYKGVLRKITKLKEKRFNCNSLKNEVD